MAVDRICRNAALVLTIIGLGLINRSQCTAFISDYVKIAKCCPQGSELIIVDDSGIVADYQCESTGDRNQTFFGYNLEIPDETNIPPCSDVKLIDFDADGGLVSTDGCIDMYNGMLHGLTCTGKFQVEVRRLWKCCAEGFSYDLTNRECVENLEPPDHFYRLIGKSVAIFQTKVPDCESDEIFVEYESDIQKSQLIRSGLKLTNNESESLTPGKFCVDGIIEVETNVSIARRDGRIIIRACRPRDLCHGMPCVRRCCRNEMMYKRIDGKATCVEYPKNIKPTFYDIGSPINESSIVEPPVYGLINTLNCTKKYILSNVDPDDAHYISHVDGTLHVNNFVQPFSNNDYCVEFVEMGSVDLHTFVCFTEVSNAKYTLYATGLTITSVFLALTLICYGCLPKLLNLHGKTLVCHVISLLSGCISLAIVQFHTEHQLENCSFIAYFIFFCFMAAFCWQSIMCFDIWWTFGSTHTSRGMRKTKELRRFLLYSLYAWGVPAVLTALTVTVDYWHLVPDMWRPQMGSKNVCWFRREYWRPHFIFFLFPIGLHILTSAILFVLTAIHCNKIKNEINRMQCTKDNETQDKQRKFSADRAKYVMNIKLFIVMGGTWSLEILATLFQDQEKLWIASDLFNIFQGAIIFFIFVCKPNVWEAIKQRLGRGSRKGNGPTTVTTQLSVTSNGKLGKSSSTSTLSTSNTNLNVVRKVV